MQSKKSRRQRHGVDFDAVGAGDYRCSRDARTRPRRLIRKHRLQLASAKTATTAAAV
jgi:hypothetical protein